MEQIRFYETFLRYPGFKTKAITLSYDDGAYQDIKLIETLNRYGLKGTFNLNSSVVGKGIFNHNHRYGWKECPAGHKNLPEIYRGHEIAVHTYTHPYLQHLDTAQIAFQIIQDRMVLESLFGTVIQGMAYPFGLTEVPGLMDAVRSCGIRYSRTALSTKSLQLPTDPLRWNPTCHHSDSDLGRCFQDLMAPDNTEYTYRIKLKLLYIWGHSYEFENNWDQLEEMCQLISGQENVWYATNGEIMDYLDAYNHIRRSVDGHFIYNPTVTTLYLFINEENVVLEPGMTIHIK